MKKAVYCIAQDTDQANHIIDDLHKFRFQDNSISILMADKRTGSSSDYNEGQQSPMRDPALETTGMWTTGMSTPSSDLTSTTQDKSNTQQQPGVGIKKETRYSEGAATGSAVGGLVGGTLGLLAGIGSLAIPGVGPLIAAGPIMAALTGAGAGMGAGHILGGIAGASSPKYRIDTISNELDKGRVFISVYAENDEQAEIAKRVFQEDGGIDIATSNLMGS